MHKAVFLYYCSMSVHSLCIKVQTVDFSALKKLETDACSQATTIHRDVNLS